MFGLYSFFFSFFFLICSVCGLTLVRLNCVAVHKTKAGELIFKVSNLVSSFHILFYFFFANNYFVDFHIIVF